MMSSQKSLLLQVAAALNADDFDHVGEWFTDDFKLHDPAHPGWPIGHEGARQMLADIRNKVPGVKAEIIDMLEEGDRVAVRWLFSATREGELRHLSTVGIYRFTNGLISEDWGIGARAAWP